MCVYVYVSVCLCMSLSNKGFTFINETRYFNSHSTNQLGKTKRKNFK